MNKTTTQKFYQVLLFVCFIFISAAALAQTVEKCNDLIDNDGDGKVDCQDGDCAPYSGIPKLKERGCDCFDGIDNDGDGAIDMSDGNCAYYYGITYQGSEADCSVTPPGANAPFTGLGVPSVSQQNTADTQSKVAVGDVDGDGIPDAIITSKWNSEVRVIATKNQTVNGTSYSAGDIKSSYKTTGQGAKPFSGAGGCNPQNLLFEHEVLIADINGDKKAEIFTVVSNRGGNPSTPPTCFFLVGFTYTKATLTMLNGYPVQIGPDRPGTFGIADMDGDGKGEVYLRDRIFAAENGKLLASEGGKTMNDTGLWDISVSSAPCAVDINGDNKLELIVGTMIYTVPMITNRNPATPGMLTKYADMNDLLSAGEKAYVKLVNDPVEYGIDTHSSNSVADFDGDGKIDVFFAGAKGSSTGRSTIFYWNVQKGTVFSVMTPSSADLGYGTAHPLYNSYLTGWMWGCGRINLGDPTGDGKLDLTFMAGNQLFCLKDDGTGTGLMTAWTQNQVNVAGGIPLGFRTINDSRSGVLTCTVYDFNNDGHPELVYRDSQELVVVDGLTGATKLWSVTCQSHTYTEGPVIADVNGDGATDICVTCNTNNSFSINDPIQQQALGQIRLYYSNNNSWLPTRKVWNQPGYFVVNINDNLTLPFPQVSQDAIFGQTPCFPGQTGPVRPLNVFLNQVPNLGANGCPIWPAPDITFYGDTPNPLCADSDPSNDPPGGCDTNGDGSYLPTISITPPICGNLDIKAQFNIQNQGDLPITDNMPVSFFKVDPRLNTVTAADKLFSTVLPLAGLGLEQTYTSPVYSFNGPGTVFTLYVVLYKDGSVLPIDLSQPSSYECSIANNIYSTVITPDPFTVTVEKVQDNFKCANSAPDNGALRARVYKGTTEIPSDDYSKYSFQWYAGTTTASPIAGATNATITGLAEGTYSVIVTNTEKGCSSNLVSGSLVRTGNDPTVTLNVLSDQTKCTPENGKIEAIIAEGNTGYTYTWYDEVTALSLGITTQTANNLKKGTYYVIVSKDGCSKQSPSATVKGPDVPDAVPSVLTNVTDCSSPNSGSVTVNAVFNSVTQDPANYSFTWYAYNNATSSQGSSMPGGNVQTLSGLGVGYYQAVIKDLTTQCLATSLPVQVMSNIVIPSVTINENAPQTSCDPNRPNGILTAVGDAPGTSFVNPNDFTFEWFRGDNTLSTNKIPISGGPETVSGTKGETLNNAKGGGIVYTVKITTPLNCSATNKLTLTENVKVPVLTLAELTSNSICDATQASNPYNGSIKATVSFDGNPVTLPDPNYKFTWYDGTTTTTPHSPAPTDLKNPVLAGLRDGNYAAIVERTDLHCVSDPYTTPVSKTTILPVLSATSTGSNNCLATLTPDGTVTVSVTNTAQSPGPFKYTWYDGNTVGVSPLTTGANSQNGDQATAIKVGGPVGAPHPYTVKVVNTATGCSNDVTQFVADNSVIPVLSTTTAPNSICSPSTSYNGSMTVSVTNIPIGYVIGDYNFTWYDGSTSTTPHSPQPTSASTVTLGNLDVGTYSVVGVNTKTGCTSTLATNQVITAKIYPALLTSATGSNNCSGGTPDGTASYTVTNTAQHAGPFTQQWYVGTGDPIASSLAVVPTAVNNGTSVTAIKLGGPNIPAGSAPHNYTVLVTNSATGCQSFATASVPDNSIVPVLSTSVVANSMCDPTKFNGSMTVSVTNIPSLYTIADYVFTWKNSSNTIIPWPSASTTLSNVDAGTYTVTARNTSTNCSSTAASDVVPDLKVLPVIQITTTGSHTCTTSVTPDGTATATITNVGTTAGTQTPGPFTYAWYAGTVVGTAPLTTGANSQHGDQPTAVKLGGPDIPSGSAPHAYTVKVTDTNTGCSNNSTGLVADISVKPIPVLQAFVNHVCDSALIVSGAHQYDGHVDVTGVNYNGSAYGGADLTYEWHNVNATTNLSTGINASSTTNALTLLPKGKYGAKVTITSLGCTSDLVIDEVLDDLTYPAITSSVVNNTNCPGGVILANGSASVASITEGGGPSALSNYTYAWYNGATATGAPRSETTQAGPSGIQGPSTFTVEVTNKANGCKSSEAMTVSDVKVTPTIAVTVVKNNTICDTGSITPDGELLATPANMGTNFTIAWTGGGATATINTTNVADDTYANLAAGGPYTANVKNNDTGCISADDSQNIMDDLTYPVINVAVSPQTSCNTSAPNGQLAATAAGTVTYNWYDDTAKTLGHAQTTPNSGIIDQLSSDDYTIEVVFPATGCKATQTNVVPENITHPVVTLANSSMVTTCGTSPNGEATAAITGLVGAPAFPGIKYDIFYVFTKAGDTYPTNVAALIASPDKIIDGTTLPVPDHTGLAPGYLTAYVVDKNTSCESVINTVQIQDDTKSYSFNIDAKHKAGLCGAAGKPGGGIEVTVERSDALGSSCTTCSYDWYRGTPSNTGINFFDNPPDMSSAVHLTTEVFGDDLGAPGYADGVGAGTYTLVVVDTDPTHLGCGNYMTDFVPPSSLPTVTHTLTDVTDCVTPNGEIDVSVSGGTSTAGYTIKIFSGVDNTGSIEAQLGIAAKPANLSTTASLAKGEYYIEIKDNDAVNIGCPFGEIVQLKQLVLPPLVSTSIVSPNTSCDPSTAADGQVQVTVTSDATDTQPKDYRIDPINPVVAGYATPNQIGTSGASGESETIPGMKPITYTITVKDVTSNCATDVVVTVPDVQDIPDVLSAAPTAETMCANSSNGSALASIANTLAGDLTQYDFTWAQKSDMSSAVYTAAGDGSGTQGEMLNKAHATAGSPGNFWPMGTAGNGSGDRTFYVQGIKNGTAPSGVGCKTAIVQVVIPDEHISPDMTLTTSPSSFCGVAAGGVGDGKIVIVADANPSAGGNQPSVNGFSYDWTTPGSATHPVTTNNNPGVDTFTITDLGTGNFTVTTTNLDNNCAVSNTVTIVPAPYVITIDAVDAIIDQRICLNDGWVRVKQISIVDNGPGGTNSETKADGALDPPSPPSLPLYTFDWYDNATLTVGSELADGSTAQITNRTLSNDVDKDLVTNEPGDYQLMKAGTYYVVATRSDNTKIGFGCPSLPFRVDVKDTHKNPVPSLTALSNTSCLSAGPGEGEILINVTDATAAPFLPVGGYTYNYSWNGPGPIPGSPNNVPGSGDGDGDSADGDDDRYYELLDNTSPYIVTVENPKTGCKTNASATIIKNATPIFVQTVNVLNQLLCDPDGGLTVSTVTLDDRNGNSTDYVPSPAAGQGNIQDFDFEWRRVGNPFVQTTTVTDPLPHYILNSGNYDASGSGFGTPIGIGTYTVTAVKTDASGAPGAGCKSAPYQVDILDRRKYPSLTLTPLANTSCDPGFFEGEIRVRVTDNALNPPAGGWKFDYKWTASAGGTLPVNTVTTNNDGDGFGGTPAENGDSDGDYVKGLPQNDSANPNYTVEVTNTTTHCKVTGSTIIPLNGTPVFTQLVDVKDQVLCGNDGKLEVREVRLIDKAGNVKSTNNPVTDPNYLDMDDFDFDWSRGNPSPGTFVMTTNGSGGTILDKTIYSSIGFDSYYVVTKRVNGFPGKDCESAPYKIDILDKRIFPVVSMTPLANISCSSDPTKGEGEIKVNVADASKVPGPFQYTYLWDAGNPTAITTAATGSNDGDGFGGGELNGSTPDNDEDHPKNLFTGTYKIIVTNNQTTCASTSVTEIYQNSTPILTTNVDPTPQVTCLPSDAKMQVMSVVLTDRNGLTQTVSLGDFDYHWSEGTISNVVKTTQGTNGAVSGGTILDYAQYAGIRNGEYYVVSERVTGAPGFGCSSAPYKVVIDDQRLYPKVGFASIANSSCNTLKPNGSIIATASEQNGSQANPYTFAWKINGNPIGSPPNPTQTNATPRSTLTNAIDGAYVVTATNTVTGCAFDASFNLILDQTRSTPNIIDVSTIDPLDCNPTAQAEVTKITLGSTTNSVLFPPNIPPNNVITGPVLATFTYEWYRGGIAPSDQLFAGGLITGPCIGPNCSTPTTGLTPGKYYVFVQDPSTDCKSGPKEVVINDDDIIYPVINMMQTIKQVSCLSTTGTAALQATASEEDDPAGAVGSDPYTFTWHPSLDLTGTAIATTTPNANPNTISNLVVGNYSVEVLNNTTNCKASAFYIVPDDAPTFTPQVSLSMQPRSFCVGQDGALVARVLNSDPDYPFLPYSNTTYTAQLFAGTAAAGTPLPPDPLPFVTGFVTNFEATALADGFYTVKVLDNNTGCSGTATDEVLDARVNPVVSITEQNPLTNCDPARANGQLEALVDGTFVKDKFDWYAGTSVTNPASPLVANYNLLIGKTAGSYTVRATDNITGCFTDKTGVITDQTLIPPVPSPEVLQHRTNCINPNGVVTATVNGAIFNYTFKWSNGTVVKSTPDFIYPEYRDLNAGKYTVTATDDITGCVSPPGTVEVLDKRVKPLFDFKSTPSYCLDVGKPKGMGSIMVNLTNNIVTLPGQYVVRNGQVTNELVQEIVYTLEEATWYEISGPNPTAPVGTGSAVYELFPGLYKVEVTTNEGCTNEGIGEVKTEIAPYNGISADGNGSNDAFIIDCISNFPDNNVKIFNRSGVKVFERDGYDNGDVSFKGIGIDGVYLQGRELPEGTYFYVIDKKDGSKPVAGYLELTR